MKRFIDFLEKNIDSTLSDGEGYWLQVYSDGKNGNITRGRNVLVRFQLREKNIYFYFAKYDRPNEFDYEGYPLPLVSNVDEIKNLKHKDSETLCEVIKRFIADNN
ncbi:MAG: hypothetical protein ACTTKP_04455 [Catonella sp.]|uniref:hypothetical protein n=1 Tax=Catonella sp. TaxID=2382125 RepID=UPI003F9F3C1A